MLTTRIRPKISVKPLATTKNSAASVVPFSVTTANWRGSSIALTSSQTRTTATTSGEDDPLRAPRRARASATPGSASGRVLAGPSGGRALVRFAPCLDSY